MPVSDRFISAMVAAALVLAPAVAGGGENHPPDAPTASRPACQLEPLAEAPGTAPRRSDAVSAGGSGMSAEATVAADSVTSTIGTIENIDDFLELCPTDDPAYAQIRSDFVIRHNDALVGALTCSGPVSSIPIADWTDELIVVQGLRTIYSMDRGMRGHLPWTDGTLYDWMRSKIAGINIKGGGAYCCDTIGGELYIVVPEEDDFNRDFDRTWKGISGNIGLYAHETRHVDGYGHVSCCGITSGCDANFDVNDLTAYGVQWWLNDLWLTGAINVGIGCLPSAEVSDIATWHLSSLNSQFRTRFCYTQPPLVDMPANPGGPCGLVFSDGFESDGTAVWGLTQNGTSCIGEVCGGYTNSCSPGSSACTCYRTYSGGGVCSSSVFCATATTCTGGVGCPPGYTCVIQSCCGPTSICVPSSCSASSASPVPPATLPASELRRSSDSPRESPVNAGSPRP